MPLLRPIIVEVSGSFMDKPLNTISQCLPLLVLRFCVHIAEPEIQQLQCQVHLHH